MTQSTSLFSLFFNRSLAKRALAGAGIGLVLLLILFIIVGAFNDGSWIFVMMLTVAISGACGGAFYHAISLFPVQSQWKRVMTNLLCVVVYLVGLWVGLVYGLSLVGLWD